MYTANVYGGGGGQEKRASEKASESVCMCNLLDWRQTQQVFVFLYGAHRLQCKPLSSCLFLSFFPSDTRRGVSSIHITQKYEPGINQ